MEIETLKAERREPRGTREARRMRLTGRVPGVVYGHKQDPESVSILLHDIEMILSHGQHTVQLDMGGKTESCLLKSVQYDHLGMHPVHVDFARVDLNERVTVNVPIVLRGEAPGVSDGGVIDQHLVDIEIECQVVAIPHEIRVSIAGLKLDGVIHVSDIPMPAGITAVSDATEIVCTCRIPAARAEVEPGTEGAEGAEPEVIAKGKDEDEESAD